jgi:hypothetical protein
MNSRTRPIKAVPAFREAELKLSNDVPLMTDNDTAYFGFVWARSSERNSTSRAIPFRCCFNFNSSQLTMPSF